MDEHFPNWEERDQEHLEILVELIAEKHGDEDEGRKIHVGLRERGEAQSSEVVSRSGPGLFLSVKARESYWRD